MLTAIENIDKYCKVWYNKNNNFVTIELTAFVFVGLRYIDTTYCDYNDYPCCNNLLCLIWLFFFVENKH